MPSSCSTWAPAACLLNSLPPVDTGKMDWQVPCLHEGPEENPDEDLDVDPGKEPDENTGEDPLRIWMRTQENLDEDPDGSPDGDLGEDTTEDPAGDPDDPDVDPGEEPDEDPNEDAALVCILPLTGLSHCLRIPCPRVDLMKLIHKVPWESWEIQDTVRTLPISLLFHVPALPSSFLLRFPSLISLPSCPSGLRNLLCHSLFLVPQAPALLLQPHKHLLSSLEEAVVALSLSHTLTSTWLPAPS